MCGPTTSPAASASGGPVPSPAPGPSPGPSPSPSQCKWDGSSCCSLDDYNVNQKCPSRPELPKHAIVGYWGSGGPNNQNFQQIYDALDKGYNIIVLAFGPLILNVAYCSVIEFI